MVGRGVKESLQAAVRGVAAAHQAETVGPAYAGRIEALAEHISGLPNNHRALRELAAWCPDGEVAGRIEAVAPVADVARWEWIGDADPTVAFQRLIFLVAWQQARSDDSVPATG